MKLKKVSAILLVAAMSFSLLAGCGSSKKEEAPAKDTTEESGDAQTAEKEEESKADTDAGSESAAGGEKTVIRVTKWGDDKPAAENILVEEFNASQDAIEIQLDVVPGDGYGDRLTTSFSSGDGYDIFLSGEGDFYKWVDLGMVEPLDDLIAADTDWQNPMGESVMEMGVVDGSQRYLVKDYNPICLWYNKDMFDAAGVDYPSESWTWDDLYEAAKKLTTKNENGEFETFGFQAQSWNYAVDTYLESLGYSYVSEDYSTAEGYLNSQGVADALDTYFGWTEGDDRISPNAADTDTYGDGTAMMINNKLAMFITGGWAKTGLEDAGVNYATALVPGNHAAYFCASGYAISSSCKNKEAAWEVLKLLTGERASELRAQNEAAFPTAESQLQAVVDSLSDDQKALLQSLDYSVPPIGMRGKVGSQVNQVLGEVVERIVYHDADTMTILNDALEASKQK